jgi:hypothetical protein
MYKSIIKNIIKKMNLTLKKREMNGIKIIGSIKMIMLRKIIIKIKNITRKKQNSTGVKIEKF